MKRSKIIINIPRRIVIPIKQKIYLKIILLFTVIIFILLPNTNAQPLEPYWSSYNVPNYLFCNLFYPLPLFPFFKIPPNILIPPIYGPVKISTHNNMFLNQSVPLNLPLFFETSQNILVPPIHNLHNPESTQRYARNNVYLGQQSIPFDFYLNPILIEPWRNIIPNYSNNNNLINRVSLPNYPRVNIFSAPSKVPIPPITSFEKPIFVPGEILVKFKPEVGLLQMQNVHSKYSTYEIYTSPYAGFKRVAIPPTNSVLEMCKLYNYEPGVFYAEPNYLLYPAFIPNDPFYNISPQVIDPAIDARFPMQWHIPYINAPTAWDFAVTRGNGIIVAVIDSGVAYEDYTDPETLEVFKIAPDFDTIFDPITGAILSFGTSFAPGYDFVNFDSHPNDDYGHGTAVASVIAECTDNAKDGASIAFNATIMPIKVGDFTGIATQSIVSDAVYWAALNGAQVINMSLGAAPPWYSPPFGLYPPPLAFDELSFYTLETAVDAAYANGVVCIACAGNHDPANLLYPTFVWYPAAFDKCIAVSAIDLDPLGEPILADFSNYGNEVELCAPGVEIWQQQLLPDNTFGNYTSFTFKGNDGTSFSAPIVSSVVALMLGVNSTLTPLTVQGILWDSAARWPTQIFPNSQFGYGCVDAFGAIDALL